MADDAILDFCLNLSKQNQIVFKQRNCGTI